MRWLRRPVVHFVILGAALFAAKTLAGSWHRPLLSDADSERIEISAERVGELRRDWRARTGMHPGQGELDALIRTEVEDELLIHEARRLGYHRTDPVVLRRLLRNMRFLEADPERSAEALLDDAYALGMDQTDLVVRRRLVQKMQLEVFGVARVVEPTEAELVEALQRNAERFTQPARVRLNHIFLSRDQRGAALAADADTLLAQLIRDGVGADEAGAVGDPFLFSHRLPSRSERELAKTFGPEFAERAMAAPEQRWAGPIPSAYGLHLVWVHERTPSRLSRLSSVRGEVREVVLAERGESALRGYLGTLRERTEIRVGTPPAAEGGAE